jgi:hypothetical protein
LAKEGLTVSQNIDKLDLVLQRRAVARIFSDLVSQLLKEKLIHKQEVSDLPVLNQALLVGRIYLPVLRDAYPARAAPPPH